MLERTTNMRKMCELPELTHLQFLVVNVLGSNPIKGRELREELNKRGVRKSGPAFYQLMARLEEAKMIEGWYTQEVIDGQIIKERNYKILGSGIQAWNSARDFYEALFAGPQPAHA